MPMALPQFKQPNPNQILTITLPNMDPSITIRWPWEITMPSLVVKCQVVWEWLKPRQTQQKYIYIYIYMCRYTYASIHHCHHHHLLRQIIDKHDDRVPLTNILNYINNDNFYTRFQQYWPNNSIWIIPQNFSWCWAFLQNTKQCAMPQCQFRTASATNPQTLVRSAN